MRRSALPIVILAAVVVAAVLAWLVVQRMFAGPPARAVDAGPVSTQTRALEPFTRIEANGQFEIEVRQAQRPEVTVEGTAADLASITTRVSDGRLVVSRKDGGMRGWRSGHHARVVVTTPTLEAVALAGAVHLIVPALDVPSLRIAASGASEVRVDGLRAKSLKLSASGAVEADLAGEVDEQSIALSGAGDVNAGRLLSREAQVSVSGAGRVILHADEKLDIDLSGAGKVEYSGEPKVTQRVSGFGSVKRRTGDRPGRVRTSFRLA